MKTTGKGIKALIAAAIAAAAAGMSAYAATELTDRTNANIEFTAGELEMANVPTFDFGEYNITDIPTSGNVIIYPATNNISTIQVSDLRGTGAGWELTVKLSPFSNPNRGPEAEPLRGAYIVLRNPVLTAAAGNISNPPVAVGTVTLDTDNEENDLLIAAHLAGMGMWSLGWDFNDVTLNAYPGTLLQGENTATLDWLLRSAP